MTKTCQDTEDSRHGPSSVPSATVVMPTWNVLIAHCTRP